MDEFSAGAELAVHTLISPSRVLPDQTQDEGADGADRGRAPSPLRSAGPGMPLFHDLAVPAQGGVRADDKPEPTQDRAGKRGQERCQEEAVFGGEPHPYIGAELSLQDHDLMTQSENLAILVTIAHRQ